MSNTPDWVVPVVAVGNVAVGTCLWHERATIYLTAIVKATFAIRSGGKLQLTKAEPVSRRERFVDDIPTRSLRTIREDAPRLLRAEVLLGGRAYSDDSGQRGAVQLLVTRQDRVLIDKRAVIYGNRKKDGDTPESFKTITLGYEKALGGIGYADNPAGTGAGVMTATPPNVVHPDEPAQKVTAFGPIPSVWPSRKALRGELPTKDLDSPVVAIPSGFEWGFFQTAPPDQQLDKLHGDESVEVSGVQPMGATLRFDLPEARAHVRFDGGAAGDLPPFIPLQPDTLLIDASKRRISIIWRDRIELKSVDVARDLTVVGAVELPDAPIHWPPPSERTVSARDDPHELALQSAGALIDAIRLTTTVHPAKSALVQTVEPETEPRDRKAEASEADFIMADTVHAVANQETTIHMELPSLTDDGLPPNDDEASEQALGTLDMADLDAIRRGAALPFTPGPAEAPGPAPTASNQPQMTGTILAPVSSVEEPLPFTDTAAAAEKAAAEKAAADKAAAEMAAAEKAAAEKAAVEKAAAEKAAAEKAAAEMAAAEMAAAEREAEQRRKLEAAAFAKEQAEARAAEEQRVREQEARTQEAHQNLRKDIYSGLGRNKKN